MVAGSVENSESINGHGITVEWLLNSLRKNDKVFQQFHGQRKVKEVTWKDVSDGKGFASEILRCTLTFIDSQNPSDVYTTILKIPGLESLIETSNKSGGDISAISNEKELEKGIKEAHQSECNFYNNLAPTLDAPIPKVFQTQSWTEKQKGCIHMEDLTRRGVTQSFFDSVNISQVKVFIRALAHMNKNCLTKDIKLDQEKVLKTQKEMAKIVGFVKPMVNNLIEKSKREDDFKPVLDKYRKVYEHPDLFEYAYTQAYKDQNIKSVVLHGDLHSGNIMFAIGENGDIQNNIAAIIDWQTIFEGSPMFDLARFLGMCASGVVRRQAEAFAIDYYLECLTKEFNGDKSKIPYTAEQLKMSYNYGFLTQIIGIIGCGIFMINALETKELNQAVNNAYLDEAVLKALMACEDGARLLEGEMKDVFHKYSA